MVFSLPFETNKSLRYNMTSSMKPITVRKNIPLVLSLFLVFILSCPAPRTTWAMAGENTGDTPPLAQEEPSQPSHQQDKDEQDVFTTALENYRQGHYETVIRNLESLPQGKMNAQIHLLLGAGKEKLGDYKSATIHFRTIKWMLAHGLITAIPQVPGINPGSFLSFREISEETTFFVHQEPVSVQEMMNYQVIHAPAKSIEQREKERKKKKFPWLLAIGTVLVAGTVLVLLTKGKKEQKEAEFEDIEWVKIPAGAFSMGDCFAEGDADELPVHQVHLSEFSISKYEVSYQQYLFYCQETGRTLPADDREFWMSFGSPGDLPIVRVTWYEANAFCEWLSIRTGKFCHLPTEAQWEKAARGPQGYRYPWGNEPATCILANYWGCGAMPDYPSALDEVKIHPEGQSPYGIYNMAGNAAEWCLDWYSPTYYSQSPGENPQGPGSGSYRVIRGGSIMTGALHIRTAARDDGHPLESWNDVGFRVVMENAGS